MSKAALKSNANVEVSDVRLSVVPSGQRPNVGGFSNPGRVLWLVDEAASEFSVAEDGFNDISFIFDAIAKLCEKNSTAKGLAEMGHRLAEGKTCDFNALMKRYNEEVRTRMEAGAPLFDEERN
ncbi:hypothetical protein [Caballeronia sordidicola]|uniref:Uncharacterized protein n=1 Tax=Caballeronia sordidicola TaxID=196367 RepID=A0A242MM20_CABSO|nr:hypothetical protein [Caballeronia sordidicola]OTP72368.1 hypothetical protein PAMC26510_21315 [Caballeronia sordidicola]